MAISRRGFSLTMAAGAAALFSGCRAGKEGEPLPIPPSTSTLPVPTLKKTIDILQTVEQVSTRDILDLYECKPGHPCIKGIDTPIVLAGEQIRITGKGLLTTTGIEGLGLVFVNADTRAGSFLVNPRESLENVTWGDTDIVFPVPKKFKPQIGYGIVIVENKISNFMPISVVELPKDDGKPSLHPFMLATPAHDYYGAPLGPHTDVRIIGRNINTKPDGIWTYVGELSTGNYAYYSYDGPTSLYNGPGTFHGFVNSIKGGNGFMFKPGETYTVSVYPGRYTEEEIVHPNDVLLGPAIAQTQFTIP